MAQADLIAAARRGQRQDLVALALSRMLTDLDPYDKDKPGNTTAKLQANTKKLLQEAERDALGLAIGQGSPKRIETPSFMKIVGINRLERNDLKELIETRLKVTSGLGDGK